MTNVKKINGVSREVFFVETLKFGNVVEPKFTVTEELLKRGTLSATILERKGLYALISWDRIGLQLGVSAVGCFSSDSVPLLAIPYPTFESLSELDVYGYCGDRDFGKMRVRYVLGSGQVKTLKEYIRSKLVPETFL